MRRSRVVLLTATVGLGLSLVLLCIVAGRSGQTLAAPKSGHTLSDPFGVVNLPLYQSAITCTLATTTTDRLGVNNSSSDNAVTLANYTGLALAIGDEDEEILVEEDWFRLDNAEIDGIYEVRAIPDKTSNYNLGIVVYDLSLTPIITDTNTANYRAEVELEAENEGPYYFKVFQISAQCTGQTYHLDFSKILPTSTPGEDRYEPNDNRGTAYYLPVSKSASATGSNFAPSGDVDWFAFYARDGGRYEAYTHNLSGVDTRLEIFDPDGSSRGEDDDGGEGFGSRVEWEATRNDYYFVLVTNNPSILSDANDTYDLTVREISVGATDTPRPASPNPDADRCDRTELGNHDFDHACVISADVAEQFSFVPPPFGGSDNDFFKIWVKPGLLYDCSTSDLSAGVDPNMILYDHNRNAIGGNDDIEPGNFNSRLAYYATYDGWMYVLVGTGDRTPTRVSDSDYTLRCAVQIPGQATATPSNGPGPINTPEPTAGPGPQTRTPAPPSPTPTPFEELTVRTLTTPTPVPATTPAPRFIPIRLLVYYDGNDDQQPGAGEGISGISAQAYEVATNQLLAQGFTDERGNLEFTVAAQGPVRVTVPFFGFRQLVAGQGASIYLRVPPQPLSRGMP